jgi:hypothetical protein
MDHGRVTSVGGSPEEILTPETFSGLAYLAWHVGKHILFVIDASHSTTVAENAWEKVRDAIPGLDAGDPGKFVGFLTSGRDTCFTSAIVVSQNQELVYMIPGHHPPHESPIVNGCRIHNSMFTRQLNWVTAYGLEADSDVTLEALPDYLNGPEEYCYGFQAEFVGRGREFGSLPMRYFFPWSQGSGNVSVRGRPGVEMTDLVPSERMGDLYDDACNFWNGSPEDLQGYFVEIAPRAGGGVRITGKGKLEDVLGFGHPVANLCNGRSRATEGGVSDQGRVRVPLGTIYAHLSRPRGRPAIRRDPAFRPTYEDCRLLERFMGEINGPVGTREWTYLPCILGFGRAALQRAVRGDDEALHDLIRAARDQMEEELLVWERGQGTSPGFDGHGGGFDDDGSEDDD